jgi:hypothetical protein
MSTGSTSGSSGLPSGPNAQAVGASSSATGTLVFIDGSSLSLGGSFSPSTGILALRGTGGSFLDGTLSGGALSGTAASSGSSGIFVSFPPAASGEISRVLCGTFSGSDVGFWNIVIAPTGAVRGVAASIRSATYTTLSGTLSGTVLSLTSSQPGSAEGALSADGTLVAGTWLAQGSGTFQGGTGSCGTTTPGTPPPTAPPPSVSGSWVTPESADPRGWIALLSAGSVVSGSGVLTTSPIVPTTGPSAPAWTGDAFTITSGSFVGSTVMFSASLGSNPVGNTFVHGTLLFTGTLTGTSTLTGTMNFTPPRTATQVFAARSVTDFVLLRR